MKKTMKSVLRSFVACLLALLMVVPVMATEATDVTGLAGEGTKTSPYLISTLAELEWFRDDVNAGNNYSEKYVKLTADIDLGGAEWTPIGYMGKTFVGNFDGGNHTISNLVITKTLINSAENNGVGFFGRTDSSAVIQNLVIENVDITGSLYVGAVVGHGFTGNKIENVTVKGDIAIDAWWYAGVIGGNGYLNLVKNCHVVGNDGSYIKGNDGSYVGGIWGFRGEGSATITDCTVSNIAISGVDRVGGISGIAHYGNTISSVELKSGVTVTATDVEATTVGVIAGACQGTEESPAVVEDVTVAEDVVVKVGDEIVTSFWGSNIDGTTAVVKALPDADVIELGSITVDEYNIWNGSLVAGGDPIDLQIAMQFKANDSKEEAMNNFYGDYITDFYITLSGMSGETIIPDEDCYLAGNYGDFGWIMIPLASLKSIENEKVYPVITSAGFEFQYTDICDSVKEFMCGIHLSEEILKANPNLEVTLELGLSENLEAAKAADFVIVDGYTYDTTDLLGDSLPNAEVIDLGDITVDTYRVYDLATKKLTDGTTPFDLQIAMQFLAKDTPAEAALNAFGEYTTDFYITFAGIENGSFDAKGCYLAGHYGDWGWIMIPIDSMTIKNGVVYPVITSVGFDFSYVDICDSVKDFKCGIYFTDEILNANPDMIVTLELGLSETAGADFIRVGDAYTYTADELAGKFAKITSANVTLGETLTMNYKVVLGKAYTGATKATMNFYRDGELSVENVAGVATDDGAYIYSFEGITPQCIGDNIKAELCFNSEVIAEKDDYSVKQNLLNIKNKTTSDKLVTLIDNTLVYGAAAQTYRNYKTDALVTAGLELANKTTEVPGEAWKLNLEGKGTTDTYFKSATVWFSNVNSLAFKYVGEATAVVTVNGKTVTCEKSVETTSTGNVNVVKTPGITALQMDDVYTVDLVVDNTVVQTLTYSVNSYIYSKTNSEDKLATPMGQLALALYNYGIAAEAYSSNT